MEKRFRWFEIIILVVSCIAVIYSAKCPLYFCTKNMDKGICLSRSQHSSDSEINIHQCPGSQYCPFEELIATDEIIKCKDNPRKVFKLYPGGKCNDNNDCISGICKDGICEGVPENNLCILPISCYYGLICRIDKKNNTKLCLKPLKEGEHCDNNYECESSCGCMNNICTKYFSLPDDSQVPTSQESSVLSFCQSGYEYRGVCKRFLNMRTETPCDEYHPCKYIDYSGSPELIQENCECGFNPKGEKFCKIGSGDHRYQDYINMKKELLLNNPNCHLFERNGLCAIDQNSSDPEIQKKILKYTQLEIVALKGHQLFHSQKCALNVFFPQYDPQSGIPKCPKFQCIPQQKNCAESKYNSISDISVTFSDICADDEYCDLGEDPEISFLEEENIVGSCKSFDHQRIIRYPGEECCNDDDCMNPDIFDDPHIGKCKENKCSGYKEGSPCKSHDMCWKGLFCSPKTGKCEIQKMLNEPCKDSYECKNKYLCYENKCQDNWYTLSPGASLEGKGDLLAHYYCEYGLSFENECARMTSKATYDPQIGLAKCEFGSLCQYDYEPSKFGTYEYKCSCGLNAVGQAYCPKPHNVGKILINHYL